MLHGAVLSNLERPTEAAYKRLAAMRASAVQTFWIDGAHHGAEVYHRLGELPDLRLIIVRVGPSRQFTPPEWIAAAREADDWPTPPGVEVVYQVGNEPNLPAEGAWGASLYGATLRQIASEYQDHALASAPLSLNGDWQGYMRELVACAGGTLPTKYCAVNAYAENVDHAGFFGQFGAPVILTETGNLAHTGKAAASWYVEAVGGLELHAALRFIAEGKSHGAWDERYVMTDAEAAGIGAHSPFGSRETPTPSVPLPADPSSPWARKLLYVWELPQTSDGIDQLAADCDRLGCSPLVKIADGDSSWVGGRVDPMLVKRLADSLPGQLAPRFWTYNYCDLASGEDRGGGRPELEADAALAALDALDADPRALIIDLEIESEGHADMVAILCDRLERAGVKLAAAVWSQPSLHPGYAWDVLARYCSTWLPMLYDEDGALADFPSYPGVALVPTWGTGNAAGEPWKPGATTILGMELADAFGCRGEAYWRWGALPPVGGSKRGQINASDLIRARRF